MVYVILVNYNNSQDTIECIESLLKIEDTQIQIIVVDNNSTLKQRNILKTGLSQFSEVELLINSYNLGFSGGCNIAIKEVLKRRFDYIWLLNNDTIITRFTLSSMIKLINENPSIGVCGSKIIDYNNRNIVQSIGGRINHFFLTTSHIKNLNKFCEPDYIVGASMLISKDCIEVVGLLNEDYFLYYEDVDYTLRVKEKGFKVAVSLDSIVYHKEGGASKSPDNITGKSEFIDLLQIQNRKVLAREFGFNMFGVCFGIVLASLNRIRRGQFERALKVFYLVFRDYSWKR